MSGRPQPVTEAKLAWLIWQALEKLNGLLWDHYEKDFLAFAMEDENPANHQDISPEF